MASWAERIPTMRRTAALAVASFAVGFLLMELLSRWLLPAASPIERIYPVETVRVPQPYTMFGGLPYGQLPYPRGTPERLNRRGYRGAEPAAVKPAGEFRVFVVGGSTVFEGNPSLPQLLEAQLHEAGLSGARCFNYGVISSMSGQELVRIVFEISELEPDLVVMFNGGNDLTSPVQYDPRPGYPFNFLAYENNPLMHRDVSAYPTWTLLAYGSNVLRAVAPGFFARRLGRLDEIRAAVGYLSPEWRDRIAADYVGTLLKAQRVSEAFGSDFVAFFQPVLFYKPSLGPDERQIIAPLEGFAIVTRDLRERTVRELERAREQEGLEVRDLSGIFDAMSEDIFYDFIHVIVEGKEILARAMTEDIVPRIRERQARGAGSGADSGGAS